MFQNVNGEILQWYFVSLSLWLSQSHTDVAIVILINGP